MKYIMQFAIIAVFSFVGEILARVPMPGVRSSSPALPCGQLCDGRQARGGYPQRICPFQP